MSPFILAIVLLVWAALLVGAVWTSRRKRAVVLAGSAVPEAPWWDRDFPESPPLPDLKVVRRVVNNRVLLLGLDQLYREAMKPHEQGDLLACARRVAQSLRVARVAGPVEGYYTEHPDLTEYFQLVHALQDVSLQRTPEVEKLAEFQRLLAVTSSPMFGQAEREWLLPKGRDPLTAALSKLTDWNLPDLLDCAANLARQADDYSLVGLAARAKDPVALAGLRESVVLYASEVTGEYPMEWPEYVWHVDAELAAAAMRFVSEFNRVIGYGLPQPTERRAWVFWTAAQQADVVGRCVRLGRTDTEPPHYYHWAVVKGGEEQLGVQEFWADRVWTTRDYRNRGPEPVEPVARGRHGTSPWLR